MLGFLPSAIGGLTLPILAQGDASAGPTVIAPALILVLCVAAAVGILLLLPSRREAPLRKIGGVVLLAAGLIFVALLMRAVAGDGSGMGVYFWIFAAIAVVGAVRVITHPKPVYSALYFVLTVMATAGLFVLMWAEFMAAALVLIYAGAILVTYVFVIMLAAEASPAGTGALGVEGSGAAGGGNGSPDDRRPLAGLAEHDAVSREPLAASAVGFALLGVFLFVIFERNQTLVTPIGGSEIAVVDIPGTDIQVPSGPTQELGVYLFRRQLVSLELAGLILTVAMVGAIIIARRRVVAHAPEPADITAAARGETVVGPATPIDDDPHSIPVYGTDNPRQKAYPET
jgi:NADH-quinone oxidoreductase subunit J